MTPGAPLRALRRLPLAALLCAAAAGAASETTSKTNVEQLQVPQARSAAPVTQITPPAPGAARAVQAPPGARNEVDAGLEARLERPPSASPEASLYRQVAEVWQVIRRRGQQPTPERIVQEIGPENLTNFLNAFPGSENMFGVDSDKLPVPAPDAPPPRGR